MYAETCIALKMKGHKIARLVSSFVFVLTLSDSFAGAGSWNPGRWTVHLKFPYNQAQWQEQRDAAAEVGPGEEGGRKLSTSSLNKNHGSTNNVIKKEAAHETRRIGPPGWSDARLLVISSDWVRSPARLRLLD